MTIAKKSIAFGEHTLTIEVGEIARQATASAMVSLGDTVILVTVVGQKEAGQPRDFFPLTVNYQERNYAAGKIPGGFLKREGRPSENEVLTSRLMDRPIRPLFPEGFTQDVQVIATVMSMDPEINPDVPALVGASAVLALSGIPFQGPFAAARVGYHEGVYLLNPTRTQLADSELDLVVAGTKNAVLMVESSAKELSEQIMLGAVVYGQEMFQPVIQLINELASEAGNTAWDWQAPSADPALHSQVSDIAMSGIIEAYQTPDKQQRKDKLKQVQQAVLTQMLPTEEAQAAGASIPDYDEKQLLKIVSKLEKEYVRSRVLASEPRIDGRSTKTVRPIYTKTGLLPRAHGSALFTRGETQAIVATTLGTERDAQMIDALHGEYKDAFMLHYNFPPYCVGEINMMMGPKRREIGHGRLARRAMEAVLPTLETFPYVIRVVSEITESNGSSSMASVCGTSLALMDASVPIKAPVAGIAMGLVKEGDRYVVLSDINGDEDHLGDMDFKVAGTQQGITALQMDIKIDGITQDIMEKALGQAREGRLGILEIMNRDLSQPKESLSEYAPRIFTMQINPDKIRDVIGKGGATIRSITDETGVNIDIGDTGLIKIFAVDGDAADRAIERIKEVTAEPVIGEIYDATVVKVVDFGGFISIMGSREGLLHISQIRDEHIDNINDVLKVGDQLRVKLSDIDRTGKLKFTMKFSEKSETKESENNA